MGVMRYVQTDDHGMVEAIVDVGRPGDPDDETTATAVMAELAEIERVQGIGPKAGTPLAGASRFVRPRADDRPEPGVHIFDRGTGRIRQATSDERKAWATRRGLAEPPVTPTPPAR